MLHVRFTELADSDLFNIYVYTYQAWGETQAQKYTDSLNGAINRLAEAPERAGTSDRSSLYPGCRSYRMKSHLIFYRVVGDSLEILRVLHGKMDIPSRLAEALDEDG
jgi:toxin ParE1/3/4